MNRSYDVIVVGAGPGGSAAAFFLARRGLRVLLLDKAEFPRDKTCGDGLTPRALNVLEELGVLEELAAQGCRMDEAMVYAPQGSSVTTQVPERPDLPPFMLAVPRLVLDETIYRRAVAAGAEFRGRVRIDDIVKQDDGVLVSGRRDGSAFTARGRMAVIAVGANVRLLMNLGLLKETPRMILAARTYFEELEQLSGRFEFHFDGVPLPGYGWVFPLSENSANIGAGVLAQKANDRGQAPTARQVLDEFLKLPLMQKMTANARQVGPVKGFPLRTDFADAPTYGPGMMLVGEAAGLVNPLTGEGVDYALESARIAAQHLLQMFADGDFGAARLQAYDEALRLHFQRLFVFSSRIRDWYLRKPILNRLVYVAQKRDELRSLFTDVVLGNTDAAKVFSLKTLAQIAFTR